MDSIPLHDMIDADDESNSLHHNANIDIPSTKSLLSDDSSYAGSQIPRDKRTGFVARLGKLSFAILLASFAMCLGCLAFLTFLWTSSTQNPDWRHIVLSGWTTRSVTVTSLVLRWATAIQATTCTSMLAAVLLQVGEVPLHTAAAVSIMRFDNTGPWSLLRRMKGDWQRGSILIFLLAALLSLTTLSLQFTSTVLLSQVGQASLPVATSVPETYYGPDMDGPMIRWQLQPGHSYLHTTPIEYPAFAELATDATISAKSDQNGQYEPNSTHGISDTGTVMRAFLPIEEKNDRSRLTEYNGFGTVVDMRVVCMRPNLTDVVFSAGNGFRVSGFVNILEPPKRLIRDPGSDLSYILYPPMGPIRGPADDFTMSFDCGFAAHAKNGRVSLRGWPLALCVPNQPHGKQGIYSVMDPKDQEQRGDSYIIINATMTEAVTDLDGFDVWEYVSLQANDATRGWSNHVDLQITLCMTTFQAQELELKATRSESNTREPDLSWNKTNGAYDSESVLLQLGAMLSNDTKAGRGIFDLFPRSWQRKGSRDIVYEGIWETTSALDAIKYAGDIYSGMINNAQYSVFAQMARSTRDPALALQAFLSNLCAMAYYDRISMFGKAAPSTQVHLVQVNRPIGGTGFIIVVTVLGVHLFLVLVVICGFYFAEHLSRIGNAWVAISQVLGPATEDWIKDADLVDDKAVKAWLKNRGLHKSLVQVEEFQGRVQIVKKAEVSSSATQLMEDTPSGGRTSDEDT